MERKEISDDERTVIQIEFEDGKMFLNCGNFCLVDNPYDATRYAPLDDKYPERKKGQDEDIDWMKVSFDGKITIEPFLKSCENYKIENDE